MSSHGSRILIASIKPIVPVVRGPFKYRVAVLQAEERQRKRKRERERAEDPELVFLSFLRSEASSDAVKGASSDETF